MKERLKRLALICGCVTMLLCMFALGANAYTYESMPSNWEELTVTVGNVTMPLERYPAGTVYDPEKRYMTQAEQADYGLYLGRDLDLRGWECMGFARYVYAALFFKYPQNATIDTHLASSHGASYAYDNMIEQVLGSETLEGGYSAATLKKLFTACRPGAVMRVGGHSMVLMAIFDDGFLVYDANYSSDNEVDVRMYTWDSFISVMGGRTIYALQMPKYYPGFSYSIGANGPTEEYKIDTSTAGTYVVYDCSELNVRAKPSSSSTRVGSLKSGTLVEIMGTYNGWAKIYFGNTWCWISTDYLRPQSMDVDVTFDANGGTISYTSDTYESGSPFGTMPSGTKTDRLLVGWKGNGATYTEKSIVPSVSELLLKAQWCVLGFRDVLEDDWFAPYVERSYHMNLISDGTAFDPNSNATRSQIVTVLGREYERESGSSLPNVTCDSFGDVPDGAFYEKYCAWGAETGIVKGVDNNAFGPNINVTREQIATFLYRLAKYQLVVSGSEYDVSYLDQFNDGYKVSSYAQEPMCWAIEAGIMKGDDKNCLNPQSSATRAEMITMMVRFGDYFDENELDTTYVYFDANGGTTSETSRRCVVGAALGSLPQIHKENRQLLGWYNGSTLYTARSAVPAGGVTLTAKWSVLGYQDVAESVWYVPYLENCYKQGLLEPSTYFYPDAAATRSEILTLLGRSYEAQFSTTVPTGGSIPFVDVDVDADYADYLAWGVSTGIVKGVSETEFGPDWEVTRAQLTLFLYRLACYTGEAVQGDVYWGYLDSFYDSDEIAPVYQEAVCWAVEAGILSSGGYMNPDSSASRAQVVTMLSRYLDYAQ